MAVVLDLAHFVLLFGCAIVETRIHKIICASEATYKSRITQHQQLLKQSISLTSLLCRKSPPKADNVLTKLPLDLKIFHYIKGRLVLLAK